MARGLLPVWEYSGIRSGFKFVSNPFEIVCVIFVAMPGRVVGSCDARRLKIALRIAKDSFVQIVRMGADFNQAGAAHFVDLFPSQQLAPSGLVFAWPFAVGTAARLHPTSHYGDHGRKLVLLEQGKHYAVKTGIAVIEVEQHRFFPEEAFSRRAPATSPLPR